MAFFSVYLSHDGGMGESISGNMGGLNRLTGGLGDHVLNVRAGDLGDGVAVLNLDGNNLDLGVVDTVLGGDLTASMLDSGDSRVGNSVSHRGNSSSIGGSKSAVGEDLGIGISVSLSLDNMSGQGSSDSRSITDGVNNILAHFLVLDLFGVNDLLGADVLCSGDAGLGDQDLILDLAVGGSGYHRSGIGGSSQKLRISVGISSRGGLGCNGEEENSKKLVHDEIVVHFPRECVELK